MTACRSQPAAATLGWSRFTSLLRGCARGPWAGAHEEAAGRKFVPPRTPADAARRSHGGMHWIDFLAPRRGVWLESQSSPTAPAKELLEGDPQASSDFVAVLACMASDSHLLVSMAFPSCTAYLPLIALDMTMCARHPFR